MHLNFVPASSTDDIQQRKSHLPMPIQLPSLLSLLLLPILQDPHLLCWMRSARDGLFRKRRSENYLSWVFIHLSFTKPPPHLSFLAATHPFQIYTSPSLDEIRMRRIIPTDILCKLGSSSIDGQHQHHHHRGQLPAPSLVWSLKWHLSFLIASPLLSYLSLFVPLPTFRRFHHLPFHLSTI